MQNSSTLIRLSPLVLLLVALLPSLLTVARADEKPNVIDWSKGSTQDTNADCGEFTFKNIQDYHTYSFFVRGTGSGACVFHADGLTFRYPSNYGPVTNGARTFFAFARFGSDVLVTWTPGY